ncbi:unnamed protein product, partial [Didymodactylos carnosus]
ALEEDDSSQSLANNEAICDLYSTYRSPPMCFHHSNYSDTLKKNIVSVLQQRQNGLVNLNRCSNTRFELCDSHTFCGQFTDDGAKFVNACQDHCIRLYNTCDSKTFTKMKEVEVNDVGWSIIDTAFSPLGDYVAYSCWTPYIYLVKLNDDTEHYPLIRPLKLDLMGYSHFCLFSLQFSKDSSEIVGGGKDACVYVYDLEKQKRTLRAHDADVNAVRFADASSTILFSGSDDGLISIWDRRALKESSPKPVGNFAGHSHGITFIDSRGDTRYMISNSKDQSIKLWDMRRFANNEATEFSTGQKYIIAGSADGCVYIYDILTGKVECRLKVNDDRRYRGRDENIIRDVAWHPYENYIVSTSWSNSRAHIRWSHSNDHDTSDSETLSRDVRLVSVQSESRSSMGRSSISAIRDYLLRAISFGAYDDEEEDDDEEFEEDAEQE